MSDQAASAIPGAVPRTPARRGPRLGRMRDLALLPAILALLVVGALVSPSFLTYPNLVSVLGASAARA